MLDLSLGSKTEGRWAWTGISLCPQTVTEEEGPTGWEMLLPQAMSEARRTLASPWLLPQTSGFPGVGRLPGSQGVDPDLREG